MSRGKALWTTAIATLALLIAIALAGADRGVALYAYVLALTALALALLRQQIRTALPATVPLDRRLQRTQPRDERVIQLETLSRRIGAAETSSFDLHYRLRPLLREIAAARLARQHGIELDRQPDRSQALVGEQLWELIRPERQPPEQRFAKGISPTRIRELIDELEAI